MLELYFIFKFYPNFFVITTPTLISATNQRQRLTMLLHLVGQLIGKRMLDEKRLFTQCGRNISRAKVLRRECFTKPTASSSPQLQTRNIQPLDAKIRTFLTSKTKVLRQQCSTKPTASPMPQLQTRTVSQMHRLKLILTSKG